MELLLLAVIVIRLFLVVLLRGLCRVLLVVLLLGRRWRALGELIQRLDNGIDVGLGVDERTSGAELAVAVAVESLTQFGLMVLMLVSGRPALPLVVCVEAPVAELANTELLIVLTHLGLVADRVEHRGIHHLVTGSGSDAQVYGQTPGAQSLWQ